jgi:hypothetical protein
MGLSALDFDDIVHRAQRRAEPDSFVDESYREALTQLLRSAAEHDINPLGRWYLRETIVGHLANGQRIECAIVDNPSVLDVPIERPVFIVSPFRTGTTLIHRLLGTAPEVRTLSIWEMVHSLPAPNRETYRTDPRIRATRREMAFLNWMLPEFKRVHPLRPDAPEECHSLFACYLMSSWFTIQWVLDSYREWLEAVDWVPAYTRYKRQLQWLTSDYRTQHLVLKAPMHLMGLHGLLRVFPDARIIQIHRDPTEWVPSTATLMGPPRERLLLNRQPCHEGRSVLETMSRWLSIALDAREKAEQSSDNKATFTDVSYADLVAEPVRTVRRISEQTGLPWSDERATQIRTYLAKHPQNRWGPNFYSLEQVGLSPAQLRGSLDRYYQRFGRLGGFAD